MYLESAGVLVQGHGHSTASGSWLGCGQRAGQRRGSPRRSEHTDAWQEPCVRSCPLCSHARTLCMQNVWAVKAKGPLFPFACRKDRSCSVLCCVSALPSPDQPSPEGGFLAGSRQEFLAITSQCPSMQLLKAADGDMGCSCARLVALQVWFRLSRAYASNFIYTQSSHSLL